MAQSLDHPKRELQEEVEVLDDISTSNKLILYNDDVHTFDEVISALIQVCGHDALQAEQCTILVHYKGKCVVKTGTLELLEPMHQKLISKSLTSEII